MNWPFEQLQAKTDTSSRWEPAYLGMELRTAEMFAVLVLPSGLVAEILSDKKFTGVLHLTQMEQEWACQSGKGINT